METNNSVQSEALGILLHETFSHVTKQQHDAYIDLAKQNSMIRNIESAFFIWDGVVYPTKHVNTSKGALNTNQAIPGLPNLHYTLLPELTKAQELLNDAGYMYIKNFFIAVLNHSYNGLVLDALLPTMLINSLKSHLTPAEFEMINAIPEPIADTKTNIARIQNHYADTMVSLRHVMMDKLLMEG